MNSKLSKYAVILSMVLVVLYIGIKAYWKDENRVIASDVIDYYGYLPATFIFHDLGFKNPETIKKGTFYLRRSPIGGNVMKMSMGMSIVYAPFFLIGHAAAHVLGYEAYGFSEPYRFMLLLGAVVYLLLGLYYLRKILLRFFPDYISAIVILAIVLGTNLAHYATIEGTMSHVYLFALINVFLWHTILWHETPTFKRLFGLGALAGFITLIRPSNIIILLFFFLYGVSSFSLLKEKVTLVFRKFHWFLGMLLAFLLVWTPQFIYNLHFTGQLLFYSYTNERFFFNNPQIIDGLFSYRKGWLLYTPMMAISMLGIGLSFFKMKEISWATFLFIASAMYIIFSWWCWWYGGSFGQRPFVDYYGMLAIPLALVLSELAKHKKWMFATGLAMVVLFTVLNLFQMQKYARGSIHFADMTKAAYWQSFWSVKPRPGFYELLETPDYNMAKLGIYVVKQKEEPMPQN